MKKFLINKILRRVRGIRKKGDSGWKEIVIFIHGISLKGIYMRHDEYYSGLHHLVQKEQKKLRGEEPSKGKTSYWPEKYIGIEWGWGTGEPQQSIDRFLSRAENWIAEGVLETVERQRDWTLNPMRLATFGMREMILYGLTSIFYYALEEGEKSVRTSVFKKILSELKNTGSSFENLSMTFLCHSAGSVIAHDFLFALFNSQKVTQSEAFLPGLRELRKKAQKGRIRLRRFYTFGSPLTPLLLRSNSVVKRFAEENTLDPKEIGILPFRDLQDPRWINFWEKDDILSFPIGPLYGNPNCIEDYHPGIPGFLSKAHSAYWESEKLARRIAETY